MKGEDKLKREIHIGDETGSIKVTLWEDEARRITKNGEILYLKDVYATEYKSNNFN